jgi:hypothetical protein
MQGFLMGLRVELIEQYMHEKHKCEGYMACLQRRAVDDDNL